MTDVVGNPEEERRAEFYFQPWAQEAVCRYFYSKVGAWAARESDKGQGSVPRRGQWYELPIPGLSHLPFLPLFSP